MSSNKLDTPRNRARGIVEEYNLPDVPIAYAGYDTASDFAMAMVDCYYCQKNSVASPVSIAAASIYAASLMANRKVTQNEMAEEFGIGSQTVGRYYMDLLNFVFPDRKEEAY